MCEQNRAEGETSLGTNLYKTQVQSSEYGQGPFLEIATYSGNLICYSRILHVQYPQPIEDIPQFSDQVNYCIKKS
jgi:hypothetical protein